MTFKIECDICNTYDTCSLVEDKNYNLMLRICKKCVKNHNIYK